MMDAHVAISKIKTGLARMLKDDPKWSGRVHIELRFKEGRVTKLKKIAMPWAI